MVDVELIREWIRAEIEYAIQSKEEDSCGYRQTCIGERAEADRLFSSVKEALNHKEG